jgi:hypothetical protein
MKRAEKYKAKRERAGADEETKTEESEETRTA